jgi:HAD superfamily hydrolase (TIGR01509 family)
MRVRAISLDLDDTLWPYAPVARHIAEELGAFLTTAAPRAAARYDADALVDALTAPRDTRGASPDYARWMERAGLRRQLLSVGEEPALADAAIAVTADARQHVTPFPDVEPAIARLSARYRLIALTDGSSDVVKIGIDHWFDGVVTGREVGASKPDPRIFRAACDQLGRRPAEVLHAGDDLDKDVAGALAAGLQSAWIQRTNDAEAPAGVLVVPDLLALASALDA